MTLAEMLDVAKGRARARGMDYDRAPAFARFAFHVGAILGFAYGRVRRLFVQD